MMRVEAYDRDLLRRYLLGQLSADEEERVEDRFMADDAYFGVYQEVEQALIRDYAAGTMDSRGTGHFEASYLVTGERRRQAIIVRALLAAAEEVPGRMRLKASGNFRVGLIATACAVAALMMAVILTRNPRLTLDAAHEIASRTAQPLVPPANASVAPAASASRSQQGARGVGGHRLPDHAMPPVARPDEEVPLASGKIAENRRVRAGDHSPESMHVWDVAPKIGQLSLPVEGFTNRSANATTEQDAGNAGRPTTARDGLALVATIGSPTLSGVLPGHPAGGAGRWPTGVFRSPYDAPDAVRRMLLATYPLTTPTADEKDIVTPGAAVILKEGYLAVADVADPIFCRNAYRYGALEEDGVGWLPQADRTGMNIGNSPPLVRMLAGGERLWVTGIDVAYDGATFHLLTDRNSGVRYAATLKFPFQSGPLAYRAVIAAAVREVFAVEGSDGRVRALQARHRASPSETGLSAPHTLPTVPRSPMRLAMAPTPLGRSASPPRVFAEESIDEVLADLGQPEKIVIFGTKQLYFYRDMKVTFVNGKVGNVE